MRAILTKSALGLLLWSSVVACTTQEVNPGPDASASSSGTGGAGGGAGAAGAAGQAASVLLPLHTQSRFIVDASGRRVKLAGANWYGGEAPELVPSGLDKADVHAIAHLIRSFGFNVVRLPWANELYEQNPVIPDQYLTANSALSGKHALEVLDAVIDALASVGLLIILDNHRSRGDWCCDTAHGDGLWHTAAYPESAWLADWQGMAQRYLAQPAVIGADLRNEIRTALPDDALGCSDCDSPADAGCACLQPSWGDGNADTDWAAAAERGGNTVLAVNPNWLVFVEGNFWATWLGASFRPVHLAVENRLVYSPHNYTSSNGGVASFADYTAFKSALDSAWGYVLTLNQQYTAPLWLGEFGTSHTTPNATWWPWIQEYMTEKDLDFSVWAINGTQGGGYGRSFGAEEGFGVLNTDWTAPASQGYLSALQSLMPATLEP